jgi:predicted TPR repeat methyltransferase
MFAKIKKLINNNHSDVAIEFKKQGDVHSSAERYEQAISCYRQALSLSPNFVDALIALGFALLESNAIDEAAQCLQQVLSTSPNSVDAHFMLGNITKSKGDLHQAIDHYIRATNINPQFEFAYRMLFEIYQTQGNTALAKSILERAMSALPSSTYFFFERAGLAFAEKDYQKAILLLQKVLILEPEHIACHSNLAKTYMQLGQDEPAIPHFEQLIRFNPDDVAIHEDLGNLYLKLGRKLDALTSFKEVVRIEPDSPLTHLVAALSGTTTPTAPVAYAEKLFDHYAQKFDSHLTQTLHYNVPTLLVSLIEESDTDLTGRKLDVLDLGCGTGLFGRAIAPFAAQIVGVDLSQKMLEKAADLNLYQRLEHNDLLGMMRAEPDASYDLIAATDVFVYVGALDELVVEAKRLLRPNGVFAFSTESLDAVSVPKKSNNTQGFELNDTGRYTHAISYLNKQANDAGFNILETKEEVIRENEGKPVLGHLSLWLVDME